MMQVGFKKKKTQKTNNHPFNIALLLNAKKCLLMVIKMNIKA